MTTALLLLFASQSVFAASPCSREWAKEKVENSSFKVIGLGLSTKPDPREAADEAKAEAIRDILLQLKTDVESKSKMEKTTSSATFSSESVLSAKLEDLKGLKPLKSGANADEHVQHCEVYEFNVQSAYDEVRGRASALIEKLQAADGEDDDAAATLDAIKAYPGLKSSVEDARPNLRRADAFKTVLGRPGPGWEEQADKQLLAIEKRMKKLKGNIWFVLPQDEKYEAAMAEVEGKLANSGVHVAHSTEEAGDGALPVQVNVKEMGKPRKSRTSMGLTISRKVMVALVNMKNKRTLATNRGINVVGTSSSGEEDDALANSDAQVTAAVVDAIRAFLPQLAQ